MDIKNGQAFHSEPTPQIKLNNGQKRPWPFISHHPQKTFKIFDFLYGGVSTLLQGCVFFLPSNVSTRRWPKAQQGALLILVWVNLKGRESKKKNDTFLFQRMAHLLS
jgi:hypothetical protein